MASEYIENAKVFKAFCDENRLRILELLRSGEKCACKLLEELHISQSTLSHHMIYYVMQVLSKEEKKENGYIIPLIRKGLKMPWNY